MINLYDQTGSNPKYMAQRNLEGRTHYVDDETLRFHRSRILRAASHDQGLLFSIITSDAVNPEGSKREFRFVIFDVFGTVLDRPELGQGYSTSERARKAMYAALDKIDAHAVTLEGIENFRRQNEREVSWLLEKLAGMQKAAP